MLIYDNAPNLLLNSNMFLAQRTGGLTRSLTGPAVVTYYMDRWKSRYESAMTGPQVSQSSLPVSFPGHFLTNRAHRMSGTCVNSNSGFSSFQIVESIYLTNLATTKLSVGVWVWVSNLQTVRLELSNANVKDTWGASTVFATVDIPVANTSGAWQYVKLENVTMPSNDRGISLGIYFLSPSNTTGACDTYFTEAMVNPGSTVARWKLAGQTYQNEVQLCRRYFEKSGRLDHDPESATSSSGFRFCQPVSAGSPRLGFGQNGIFQVDKRISGAVTRMFNHRGNYLENRFSVYNGDTNSTIGLNNVTSDFNGLQGYVEVNSPSDTTWGFHFTVDADF